MAPRPRPFFIVGNPRSGTNLLKFVVNCHQRLYAEETGYIPYLRAATDRPLQRNEIDGVVRQIVRLNRFWKHCGFDLPEILEKTPTPTLGELLDALYSLRAQHAGATRWGDRTASYTSHVPLIAEIFPTAQFVHIVRDGRDSMLSSMKAMAKGRLYMDPYYLFRHWVRRVEQCRADGAALGPERYLEIRYEDLASSPETTLRQLCDYLGEEFDSRMLDPNARQDIDPKGTHLDKPISTRSVGRWQRELSPFLCKLADHVAGPTLTSLGYDLAERGPMTVGERVRTAAMATKFCATDPTRKAMYTLGLRTAILWEARHSWRDPEPASPAQR